MKKRSRRKIWAVASALALVVALLPVVGLGGSAENTGDAYSIDLDVTFADVTTCTHGTPASFWSMDGTHHWKMCTTDGCTAVYDHAAHADGDNDGVCDDCGYLMNHDHTGWTEVDDISDINGMTSGKYYLTADITGTITLDVNSTVYLCLHGNSIDGNNGGSVITVGGSEDANLYLYDCSESETGTITGGTNGGVSMGGVGSSRFNMYGGTITRNTSTNGGGVCNETQFGATFNMYGGTITDNEATNGGGVYVDSNGTFNMYGGVISDCDATGTSYTDGGGGVYNAGAFTMEGGTITDCDAANGGGVFQHYGAFTMSGGTISGNTATGDGGGVFSLASSFTMGGGVIGDPNLEDDVDEGNSADGKGGGVYMDNTGGPFTMSGGAVVGNTAAGDGGGVFTQAQSYTNQISGGTIAHNTSENGNGGGIFSDWVDLQITDTSISNNHADIGKGGGIYNNYRSIFFSGGSIENNTAYVGGGIYNGCNEYNNGYIEMSGDAAIIGNKALDSGGGVYNDNSTFALSGGAVISGNSAENDWGGSTSGGGVYSAGGTLTMDGGVIGDPNLEDDVDEGNSATDGGGVFATYKESYNEFTGVTTYTSGQFTMTDGAINGNTASHSGGGVYVESTYDEESSQRFGCEFTMQGGEITGNTAGGSDEYAYGGGVNSHSKFSMENGTISGNAAIGVDEYGEFAEGDGGGVYNGDGSEFEMIDGTISDNKAGNEGGGIYVQGSDDPEHMSLFEIAGGTITRNSARDGGGVMGRGDVEVKMTDGTITSNTARNYGGGVGLYADFTMTGGEITDNTTGRSGGGICSTSGMLTISGGTITRNTAALNGGGVDKGEEGFKLSGSPVLTGNTASANGGDDLAIMCDWTAITFEDSTFTTAVPVRVALTGWGGEEIEEGTFTEGWADFMSSHNEVDYFESSTFGSRIVKNADGELAIKKEQHKVVYDANGGSGDMSAEEETFRWNGSVTVAENKFTPPSENQRFVNWNTEKDGGSRATTYEPGDIYEPFDAGTTTFYAQWASDGVQADDPIQQPTDDDDGDGIPNAVDPDDDNDGVPDWAEDDNDVPTSGDPEADDDGDGIPNEKDPDSPHFWDTDGDGDVDDEDEPGYWTPDDNGEYPGEDDPDDPENYVPSDKDTDGDGIPDVVDPDNDKYPGKTDPSADEDNDGIPNASDDDNDGDGIPDWYDPHVDSDGDNIPDVTDTDDDNDGTLDVGADGDPNTGDNDSDTDGDGILNEDDPDHPDFWEPEDTGSSGKDKDDPNQDHDGDGIPNAIDRDNDGDGKVDGKGDGNTNSTTDTDDDKDGIPDHYDPDADSDGDGIPDWMDRTPNGDGGYTGGGSENVPSAPLTDTDGDGIPDVVDPDDDNDGIPDFEDRNPLTPDVVDLGKPDDGCPCGRFEDVDHDEWYHEYIDYVVENGLMQGISDALFDPNGTTSRAQIVMMLWRMEGEPLVNHPLHFIDVRDGAWYIDALRWTNSEGIVLGYDDGRFGTNDPVTREQIATILWRYARFKGVDTSGGEGVSLLKFSDVKKISAYAISALQWACSEKLVCGTVNESGAIVLDPQGSATRAQVAAILMRFCENVL